MQGDFVNAFAGRKAVRISIWGHGMENLKKVVRSSILIQLLAISAVRFMKKALKK